MTQPPTRVRRPVLAQPRSPEPDPEAEAERLAIQEEARQAQAEAEKAVQEQRAARVTPPTGGTTATVLRDDVPVDAPVGFVARDGDVLVVTYSEVTLPLPRQFATMKFGGAIYTRKLREGDDVGATYRTISAWLIRVAEADGVAKYRRLVSDFLKLKQKVEET